MSRCTRRSARARRASSSRRSRCGTGSVSSSETAPSFSRTSRWPTRSSPRTRSDSTGCGQTRRRSASPALRARHARVLRATCRQGGRASPSGRRLRPARPRPVRAGPARRVRGVRPARPLSRPCVSARSEKTGVRHRILSSRDRCRMCADRSTAIDGRLGLLSHRRTPSEPRSGMRTGFGPCGACGATGTKSTRSNP